MKSDMPTFWKAYKEIVVPHLISLNNYKNIHEVPKIVKITINCCVGSSGDIKVALEEAVKELALITGQQPVKTRAKKSISNFKLRKGQEIGCMVTLRGARMYEFLERFVWAALPRVRDFRGLPTRSFDSQGNYTIGIKDHTIFPEVDIENIKRNLGFDLTIVTTAKTKKEAIDLLSAMGFPFIGEKNKPLVLSA
ncbi:50S ribosomal protein L5 [Candidatus Methylacidiphilum fumarolicum]|uniref:Large ribosomal subunit protein uL5 n=2 Tax=Candidatus Methylacidiphilum fumarolicum TaxID=591154 RepID=I0K0D0_METFB|nr:50S ribosomal protein L5 [Candidatus Methylacidiphilum fumarolicum]TFE77452.1 50S ribosomal protein L5 [Candidatus Methylacidiphilum fumarolicum]CAI9085340.1 50S ribosomal subunit protein L5 [Candidatus Methylacidiphilum fumarolicum]CCG92949.1 50S ribosomal protein L5 [Methylacidiphilum fumariolicum SolV]